MSQKVASERILYNSERYYIKEANSSETAELREMFRKFVVGCWNPSPGENLILVVIDKEKNRLIGGVEGNIDTENRKALGRGLVVLPEFQGKGIGTKLIKAAEEELKSRGVLYVKTLPKKESWKIFKENGYDWTPFVKLELARKGKDENEFHDEFMEKHL